MKTYVGKDDLNAVHLLEPDQLVIVTSGKEENIALWHKLNHYSDWQMYQFDRKLPSPTYSIISDAWETLDYTISDDGTPRDTKVALKPQKLTPCTALELSIELWKWLAETGSNDKSAWDKWERLEQEYKIEFFAACCPLCEYSKYNVDCNICPMFKRWPDVHGASEYEVCTSEGSAFDIWSNSTSVTLRKAMAEVLVGAFETALKEMEDSE